MDLTYFTENEAKILSNFLLTPRLTCISILPAFSYLKPTYTPAQDSPDFPGTISTHFSPTSSHFPLYQLIPIIILTCRQSTILKKKILLQTSYSNTLLFFFFTASKISLPIFTPYSTSFGLLSQSPREIPLAHSHQQVLSCQTPETYFRPCFTLLLWNIVPQLPITTHTQFFLYLANQSFPLAVHPCFQSLRLQRTSGNQL